MIRYYVNEEEKVVVASFDKDNDSHDSRETVLEYLLNDVIKIFSNSNKRIIVNVDTLFYRLINKYNKRMGMSGLARCHDEDKWNEEIGKRIARDRLMRKYNNLKFDIVCEIERQVKDVLTTITNRITKVKDKHKKFSNSLLLHPQTQYRERLQPKKKTKRLTLHARPHS